MIEKYAEERPWGKFTQYIHNKKCTVKLIEIKPGQKLSLQYHHKRSEFWVILKGHPQILIGDNITQAKPGDEFHIPQGSKHRAIGINDSVLFLEIATGDFDENDIVRLDDKYNRS
jgi:mannose-6-phosphate isomerase